MKIVRMFAAAGLVIASMGAATLADAQNYRGDRHDDRGRHDDRRFDRHGDRGHRYGFDRHQNRCRVEWRHHRRERVCR